LSTLRGSWYVAILCSTITTVTIAIPADTILSCPTLRFLFFSLCYSAHTQTDPAPYLVIPSIFLLEGPDRDVRVSEIRLKLRMQIVLVNVVQQEVQSLLQHHVPILCLLLPIHAIHARCQADHEPSRLTCARMMQPLPTCLELKRKLLQLRYNFLLCRYHLHLRRITNTSPSIATISVFLFAIIATPFRWRASFAQSGSRCAVHPR
jgi:hypothetical protein